MQVMQYRLYGSFSRDNIQAEYLKYIMICSLTANFVSYLVRNNWQKLHWKVNDATKPGKFIVGPYFRAEKSSLPETVVSEKH